MISASKPEPCLKLVSEKPPENDNNGIYLFSCIRNEADRLPYFLRYYRDLGVDLFFIVDNNSSDGSLEFLEKQHDVVLYHTPDSYAGSRYGVVWLNTLLHKYGEGHWCLTVDADELLVYPRCEELNLNTLTRYLKSQGANALLSFMLDMYANIPICEAEYRPNSPFLETCSYFDGTGYWTEGCEDNAGQAPSRGGSRYRLFWEGRKREKPTPFLQKIPLVLWSGDFDYVASTHLLDGAKFADISSTLLHFKFFADFVHRVEEEVIRGEHFADAFQYNVYADVIRDQPKLNVSCKESLKYSGSQQLVELELIFSSELFEQYHADVSKSDESDNYFIK